MASDARYGPAWGRAGALLRGLEYCYGVQMGTGRRERFIQRRITLGFSQEYLAAVLGIERSTVARWERGVTDPRPWQRPELARQLKVTPEELYELLCEGGGACEGHRGGLEASLDVPWDGGGTAEAAAQLSRGGHVERRTFLVLSGAALTAPAHQWLVHEPESLTSAMRGGSRISGKLVDRLPPMIADLRRMDDVAGGGSVLSMARSQFSWVSELLNQASYDEATGRKLLVTLAELGQLIGWAAFDDGQYGLAQRYYLVGLRAAHSANDQPLGAHILGCMAFQSTRYGDPAEGVTLAETALAGAGRGAPVSLLAVLYGRQAEALAGCHETIPLS